jgi:hypothetical protein
MVVLPEEVYNNFKKGPVEDPVDKRLMELANEMATILHSYGLTDERIYFEYDQRLKELKRLMKQRGDQGAGSPLFDKLAELLQKLTEKAADDKKPGGGSGGANGDSAPPPPPPPSVLLPPAIDSTLLFSQPKTEPKLEAPAVQSLPLANPEAVKAAIASVPKQVSAKRKAESPVQVRAPKSQNIDTNVDMSPAAPLPVTVKMEAFDDYERKTNPVPKKEILQVLPAKMDVSDALENRVKTVRDKVMADPAKYGVTPKGLIKGENKAVYRSSFAESLRYLLSGERGAAPPGTEHLRLNLLDDPELANLIPRPSTAGLTTNQRIQLSTGERERPPRGHHTAPFKVDRFRPALWSLSSSARSEPTALDAEHMEQYTWTNERIKARRKPKERTKLQTSYPKSWSIPDRNRAGRRS